MSAQTDGVYKAYSLLRDGSAGRGEYMLPFRPAISTDTINMCLLTYGGSPCDHSACESPAEPPALSTVTSVPSSLLSSALGDMNQLLCQVMQQNCALQNYLQVLGKRLAKSPDTTRTRTQATTVKGYLDLALPEPSQVFKEKGFSLTLRIMTAPGVPCSVAGLHFRVQLYSEDQPPVKIALNISGKKVLRGSVDAYSDAEGMVVFPNIVINEVSSHYMNNCFTLVVSQSGEQNVKSFALPGVVVKARKQAKSSCKTSIADIDDLAMGVAQ